jgi:hypothetical protein
MPVALTFARDDSPACAVTAFETLRGFTLGLLPSKVLAERGEVVANIVKQNLCQLCLKLKIYIRAPPDWSRVQHLKCGTGGRLCPEVISLSLAQFEDEAPHT